MWYVGVWVSLPGPRPQAESCYAPLTPHTTCQILSLVCQRELLSHTPHALRDVTNVVNVCPAVYTFVTVISITGTFQVMFSVNLGRYVWHQRLLVI